MIEYGTDICQDIAIITPYKNQKDELQKEINHISIGTVHTFQGQEKKIIIFSGVIDDTTKTTFVGTKPNLLNVAFTRGKEQVVYVGNVQVALSSSNHLENAVSTIRDNGVIYSLYDELNDNQHLLKKEGYEIFADEVQDHSSILQLDHQYYSNGMVAGARENAELLKRAITMAEESVVMVSPWIQIMLLMTVFSRRCEAVAKRG